LVRLKIVERVHTVKSKVYFEIAKNFNGDKVLTDGASTLAYSLPGYIPYPSVNKIVG